MTITALPTPPTRSDPTNFSERADAFMAALPTFATETNSTATTINNDAAAAIASAVNAAASAAGASATANVSKWVSGTTYAEGDVEWSPVNFFSYRRKIAGAGTTDPSADPTNWALVSGGGDVSLTGIQTLTNKTLSTGSIWNGTAVPVLNGGTGSTTAGSARVALNAAASGANTDITSLGAVTGVTASVGNISTLLATTAFVAANAQQPGEICFFARNTAPAGFLKANGALISRSVYAGLFTAIGTTFGVGDGSTTFALPDLRGEFARGWDDARGVDSGRVFGSAQAGEIQSHTHTQTGKGFNVSFTGPSGVSPSATDGTGGVFNTLQSTAASGGLETRPRNIALLACIKF